MTTTPLAVPSRTWRWLRVAIVTLVLAGIAVGAYFSRHAWLPLLAKLTQKSESPVAEKSSEKDHGHEHGAAESQNFITLSDQAKKNLKLQPGIIDLTDYWKKIVVPGEVSELPGRSERRINSMVQGVILKVHIMTGQTVKPGDQLFDIESTSELLATLQSNLLKTLKELEVIETELKRIIPAVAAGSLAKKSQLDKENEKRRAEATRDVQVQELLVRGLTRKQVESITKTKTLLRWFTIRVPAARKPKDGDGQVPQEDVPEADPEGGIQQTAAYPVDTEGGEDVTYVVEKLEVSPGKLVQPGDELCDLALHDELLIRGEAFESESELIHRTRTNNWPVTAMFDLGLESPATRDNLKILYASSAAGADARSFEFYLPLRNEVIQETTGPGGRSFRSWRFRPGQKVRLLVRVEEMKERFVIPAEAVVTEGAESFVFKVNGKKFEKQPVAIDYRDSREAVLANDGSLFPGDEIALNSAYQLNLALKKATGSGVADPHAGHNH